MFLLRHATRCHHFCVHSYTRKVAAHILNSKATSKKHCRPPHIHTHTTPETSFFKPVHIHIPTTRKHTTVASRFAYYNIYTHVCQRAYMNIYVQYNTLQHSADQLNVKQKFIIKYFCERTTQWQREGGGRRIAVVAISS